MVWGHLCKSIVKSNGILKKGVLKKSVSFKQADPSNALILCQFPFRDVLKERDGPESCRMLNHVRDTPQRPNMKLLLSFQFWGITQVIRIRLVLRRKICAFNSHHRRLHPCNVLLSTSMVPGSVSGTEDTAVGKGDKTPTLVGLTFLYSACCMDTCMHFHPNDQTMPLDLK